MAVVQISKIQIRRGKANGGSGIPQLASGEMAWAVDDQTLWIGNGSVSEGAPGVGNTQILTVNELSAGGNILNSLKYTYKANDVTIATGASVNTPISRQLQDRLDEQVNVTSFGAVGDGITDDTAAIQRAINELFKNNNPASAQTAAGSATRKVLNFLAGTFKITSTLLVPSYATLLGAGSDKTILSFTGTGPVVRFVPDQFPTSATGTTQPRKIRLDGFTLLSNTSTQPGLQLDSALSCFINDITVQGLWAETPSLTSIGITMNSISSLVTCQENILTNIHITGFTYAVFAFGDIVNNTFRDCTVQDVQQGFRLGVNIPLTLNGVGAYADGSSVGQQYGPRRTTIDNIHFYNVKQQAVMLGLGTSNIVKNCQLSNTGCNGGGNGYAIYPQIYFGTAENIVESTGSDRGDDLAVVPSNNINITTTATTAGTNAITLITTNKLFVGLAISFTGTTFGGIQTATTYYVASILNNTQITISTSINGAAFNLTTATGTMYLTSNIPVTQPYVPEVAGVGSQYRSFSSRQIPLSYNNSVGQLVTAFRLPINTDYSGAPITLSSNADSTMNYQISYEYKSTNNAFGRQGTISLIADPATKLVQLSDEYNFLGNDSYALLIDFEAYFIDANNNVLGNGSSATPASIVIQYANSINGDQGILTYTYLSLF